MRKQQQTELMDIQSQKIVKEQKAIDMRCIEMYKMNQKANKKLLYRHKYLEDEEEEMYTNMQKAKEKQLRQATELEQVQKLAQAMAELKHQELLEIKTNHLLHTNCHELRYVENQLRTAYSKKGLICQIKERETIKNEEKLRDHYDSLKMIEAGNNEKRAEEERKVRKNELKLEYKKALIEQNQEMKERRELSSMNSPIDDPIDDLTENNHRKIPELKKNYSLKEMEEFVKMKKELDESKRREENKLDERIEEYIKNVEKRTKQQEEIKKKKKQEKEKIYNSLVDNLRSLAPDSEKKQEMQWLLVQEEQLDTARKEEKKMEELRKIQRDQLLKQNEMQLKIKKDSIINKTQNNIVEVKKLFQNFQDYNEMEEKKNRERRQMMMDYGKELKKAIDQKNCMKIREKIMKKNEYSDFIKSEELRLAEIAKKQSILVNQHMENLKGFFPPSSRGHNTIPIPHK